MHFTQAEISSGVQPTKEYQLNSVQWSATLVVKESRLEALMSLLPNFT